MCELESNDRAITDSKTEGFVEVVLLGRKVIGCTIVSKNAESNIVLGVYHFKEP